MIAQAEQEAAQAQIDEDMPEEPITSTVLPLERKDSFLSDVASV